MTNDINRDLKAPEASINPNGKDSIKMILVLTFDKLECRYFGRK